MIDPNENHEALAPVEQHHCGGVASKPNFLMGEKPAEEFLLPETNERRFTVIEESTPLRRPIDTGVRRPSAHIAVAAALAETAIGLAIKPSEFDVEAAEKSLADLFQQASTEIGVVLRQLGRQAAEIKPAEIARFKRDFDVHVTKTSAGTMRFEVTKKGKNPSWMKGAKK